MSSLSDPARPCSGDDQLALSSLYSRSDLHLEAVYACFLASFQAAVAASAEHERLEGEVEYPAKPEAMLARLEDDALGLFQHANPGAPSSRPFYRDCAGLQHAAAMHDFYHSSERGRAVAVRAREILAAIESHHAAISKTITDSGLQATEAEAARLWDLNHADRAALISARATTMQGVLLKAQAIAALERGEEGLANWAEEELVDNGASATGLAASLTVDLIRLAKLLPAAEPVQ